MLVQCSNLSKTVNTKTVFEDVSLVVNQRDRFGVIGPNGCGKTTLLKIILGLEIANSGKVSYSHEFIPSYLPQALTDTYINDQIRYLVSALSGDEFAETSNLAKTLSQLDLWKIIENDQGSSTLSGGQKTRIALAATLIKPSTILVLDEPTNFLDIGSIEWLESYLERYDGALLVTSHDRTFLDDVVDGILSLDSTGVKYYPGGYSDFAEERQKEDERHRELYISQDKTRKKAKKDIQRTREQANNIELATKDDTLRRIAKKIARKAKARETKITRMVLGNDWVGKPQERPRIHLELESNLRAGQTVLRIDKLGFSYTEGSEIISETDLFIKYGEKVAIMGANGCGKTTLLKLIAGKLEPSRGIIWRNEKSRIAYFSQDLNELDPSQSVLAATRAGLSASEESTRYVLGGLLIDSTKITQKVSTLSMGERTRLGIARQILSEPDLIVLDEFCAHLDIDSIIQVQQALNDFSGSIILVTHDRYLLDTLDMDSYYILNDRVLFPLPGGLEEYSTLATKPGNRR